MSVLLFIPSVLLCCFPNIDLKQKKRRGSNNRAQDELDGKHSVPMISQTEKQYHNSNTLPVDEADQVPVEILKKSLFEELISIHFLKRTQILHSHRL